MKKIFKKILQYYLKYITKLVLITRRPMIIAIAGSTNKTFVKDEINKILKKEGISVRSNPKSFNTEIGLPLAILNLPSGYNSYREWLPAILKAPLAVFRPDFPRILALELGVSDPGDMKYLFSIVRPDIGIITDLTQRYLEGFNNMDKLAGEYEYLVKKIKPPGLILLNFDNQRIKNMAKLTHGKIVSFGLNEGSEWRALKVEKNNCKQIIKVKGPRTELKSADRFEIKRPGQHHIYSFLIGLIIKYYVREEKKT